MTEEIFVIALAVIVVLGAMVVAVVLMMNRFSQPEQQSVIGTLWHLEMWNIATGYQVDIRFLNTFVLGRVSVYDNIISRRPMETDPTISREHCMLYEQNGLLLAWNMSAVNPAAVNGYRLNAPRQIIPGDRIELGNSTFLITRVERI